MLFIADKFSEHAKSTLRAKLDYSAERIRFGVVTLEMWMAFSIVVVQFICFLETTVFNQQLHRSSAVLCRSDGFVQHVSGHARPLTETIFIPGANPDLNATRFRLTSITVPSSFNEDFPSLLIATAGVFSAGVVCEKMRARHQLRLILKDGIALRQCIEVYVPDFAYT